MNKNKITFEYWKYLINGNKIEKQIVSKPKVSPYALVYDKQQFYMLGIKEGNKELYHYRLDRIKNLVELDEIIKIKMTEKDIEHYADSSVEVFSGNEVQIEAECNEYLLGEVMEKFGKNVEIKPVNETTFKMKIKANPIGFKLWTMRNLDLVTVIKPTSLVKDIKEIIKEAGKRYK